MAREIDPGAISELLRTWPIARLAMVSAARGGPWLTPVVFAPSGNSIWTPVDGKPKSGAPLARLANAEADPRAALLLDEYAADWSRLWWVRIDGTAVAHRIGSAPRGAAAEAIATLRGKYPQYRSVPLFSGPPTLLELSIERVRAWRWNADRVVAGECAAGRGSVRPDVHRP